MDNAIRNRRSPFVARVIGGALAAALVAGAATLVAAATPGTGVEPVLQPPGGARLVHAERQFHPYGVDPKAILLRQEIYEYPSAGERRFFWRYRITNFVRAVSVTAPSRITALRLQTRGESPASAAASADGWMTGAIGGGAVEWSATPRSDAVLFPGYTAEFAFTTERCNLARGSASLVLEGAYARESIELGGPEAPAVPGTVISKTMVDCCLPYGGGHACGGYSTADECIAAGGRVGCDNCGTQIVSCCFPQSDCGSCTEEQCVLMGGSIVGSCSSCPIDFVLCCQTPSLYCSTITRAACGWLGYPVGSCAECGSNNQVACCYGNGNCSLVAANQCGGSVVSNCSVCAWVNTASRTWGQIKSIYR